MALPKKVETCKLQVTIDRATERILQEMISMGIHGTTKAEVAVSILRNWLWANEEKLRQNGVLLAGKSAPSAPLGPRDR